MKCEPKSEAIQPKSELQKFVIEFFDFSLGCVVGDAVIQTKSESELCSIIEPDRQNIEPGSVYDLEQAELQLIKSAPFIIFTLRSGTDKGDAQLRPWMRLDELPYRVHTNRELFLMLQEKKPLSVFSEAYPRQTELEYIPESKFKPLVDSGEFVKREHIELNDVRPHRWVMYARNSEEWRIEAYLLLIRTAKKAGWSEGFERLEGSLLGYEEWQNDCFIKQIYLPSLAR